MCVTKVVTCKIVTQWGTVVANNEIHCDKNRRYLWQKWAIVVTIVFVVTKMTVVTQVLLYTETRWQKSSESSARISKWSLAFYTSVACSKSKGAGFGLCRDSSSTSKGLRTWKRRSPSNIWASCKASRASKTFPGGTEGKYTQGLHQEGRTGLK